MDENGLDASPTATQDQPSDGLTGTSIKQVAGGTCLEEAQRLIEEQIALLFATVEHAVASQRGGQAAVRRTDRSLAIGSGGDMVEFTVEAITDVPADADPARDFPLGEARCQVRVAGEAMRICES